MEIINQSSGVNVNVELNDLLMRTLASASKTLLVRCIEELSNHYGFNSDEAIRYLNIDNVKVNVKPMAKRVAKEPKAKAVKEPKVPNVKPVKAPKSNIPMPFMSETVNSMLCHGLKYNHGLFTQCQSNPMECGEYCKGCQKEADTSASGEPKCGTVEKRMAVGLMDYKDGDNRSPIAYISVLKKLNIAMESALDEAGKLNIKIHESHFAEPITGKGRPKKAPLAVESTTEDLFAAIIQPSAEAIVAPVKSTKPKLTEAEKEEKRKQLELERDNKKKEAEAKRLAEKLEKEQKKAEEKAALEQKKAEEKAALEQKKAEEKAAAKKAPAAKKSTSKKSKNDEQSSVVAPVVRAPTPVLEKEKTEEEEEEVSVKPIMVDGVKYLISESTKILYDMNSHEEIGLYNEQTKAIDALPEDDGEEEEEEYDN
jgi:hypothetical protein